MSQIDTIVSWIQTQFAPITLATTTANIQQQIYNAKRYFNGHSAFPRVETVSYPGGDVVELDEHFKSVVQVYPGQATTWLLNNHPLWSLLGIPIIDHVSSDMITMSAGFKNYQTFVGTDFRFTFLPPMATNFGSEEGGKLYLSTVPMGVSTLTVVGSHRIVGDEDIESQWILDWIQRYTYALVMICEGQTLAKAAIADVKGINATQMIQQGLDDKKSLQDELSEQGIWLVMAQRG
jgi:hypothetical protein